MAGAHIHGVLMWTAYLILFPLGVVLMRTPSRKGNPFKRHWIIQLIATACAWTGALVGMSHTRWSLPHTPHTILGSTIALALAVQGVLGWRHHMDFLKIRKRTWISYTHIWLGRFVVVGGWTNVLIGMSHHQHHLAGVSTTVIAGVLIGVEAVGICVYLWLAQRRAAASKGGLGKEGDEAEAHALTGGTRSGDEYFVLGMSDEEGDDDEEDGELGKTRRGRRSKDVRLTKKSMDVTGVSES
ncbi:hypothetical protein B0H66DRAFT_347492 [Apodospora peruviana]|uniref:Cytochrome b561 domain-containing protein n=1 Tax=Apodospora peruviana TaxID=516989 RepID=A0AAE0M1B6_9PEZI|nr:hypothetical protein B0H66DRAFT_347492 [Apodospora peruviana]